MPAFTEASEGIWTKNLKGHRHSRWNHRLWHKDVALEKLLHLSWGSAPLPISVGQQQIPMSVLSCWLNGDRCLGQEVLYTDLTLSPWSLRYYPVILREFGKLPWRVPRAWSMRETAPTTPQVGEVGEGHIASHQCWSPQPHVVTECLSYYSWSIPRYAGSRQYSLGFEDIKSNVIQFLYWLYVKMVF